eukprot:GSMAST32.ASY1.ANO1.375.1 assembled CDS
MKSNPCYPVANLPFVADDMWPISKEGSLKAWRRELLSGITVALALIPEAVAFSFVAGVKPLVGLQAAWINGLFASIFGDRPGMITGATGALAVVLPDLIEDKHIGLLFYAVILQGLIQIVLGSLKMGRFVSMISHPVMIGFCDGLAIIIFLSQIVSFKNYDVFTSSDPWVDTDVLGLMLGIVFITMYVLFYFYKKIDFFFF